MLDGLAAASESTPEDAEKLYNELLTDTYEPIELCRQGNKILMIICKHGHTKALHYLLEEICIQTCFDINKSKAILTASSYEDQDVAMELVAMINGYYFNNEGDSDYFLAAFDTALKNVNFEMADMLYRKMREENRRIKLATLISFICETHNSQNNEHKQKSLNLLDTVISNTSERSELQTIFNIVLMSKQCSTLEYLAKKHNFIMPTNGIAFSRVFMDGETPNDCIDTLIRYTKVNLGAVSRNQWLTLIKDNHLFIGKDEHYKAQFDRIHFLITTQRADQIPQEVSRALFDENKHVFFAKSIANGLKNDILNTLLKLIKHDIINPHYALTSLSCNALLPIEHKEQMSDYLWRLFTDLDCDFNSFTKRRILVILLAHKTHEHFTYIATQCDMKQHDAAFFLKITKQFTDTDPIEIITYMQNYGYAALTNLT